VLKLVVPDQVLSLRSLSASWSSQQEEDMGLGEESVAVVLALNKCVLTVV
jgi:hypothetical protein